MQRIICRVNGKRCVLERHKGDASVLRLAALQAMAWHPAASMRSEVRT